MSIWFEQLSWTEVSRSESARRNPVNYKYFCQKLNLREKTKSEGHIIQSFSLTDQAKTGQMDGNYDSHHQIISINKWTLYIHSLQINYSK